MNTADSVRIRVREKLADQRTLVAGLLALREQAEGSLFARYAECGKESCVCRTGRKHGPYYVLSSRQPGRAGFAYLDEGQLAAARELVKRHRAFRAGLRRLRRLNEDLLTLLRRYQAAQARRGGRRLGTAAKPKSKVLKPLTTQS